MDQHCRIGISRRRITISLAMMRIYLAFWLLVSFTASVSAQCVPGQGAEFLVQSDLLVHGSFQSDGQNTPLDQSQRCVYTVTVTSSLPDQGTWTGAYGCRLLAATNTLGDATPVCYRLTPGLVQLDDEVLWSSETDPDITRPFTLLTLVQPFEASFDLQGTLIALETPVATRRMLPMFDPMLSIRQSWVTHPFKNLTVGDSWVERRRVEILSDLAGIPGSVTYTLTRLPTPDSPVYLADFVQTAASDGSEVTHPVRPTQTHGTWLKWNIGPGPLDMSPPPVKLRNITWRSSGVVRFSSEWCFLTSRESSDLIHMEVDYPEVDGPAYRTRIYDLTRETNLSISPIARSETAQPDPSGLVEFLISGEPTW